MTLEMLEDVRALVHRHLGRIPQQTNMAARRATVTSAAARGELPVERFLLERNDTFRRYLPIARKQKLINDGSVHSASANQKPLLRLG
jgi:hypothetical protein